MNVQNLRFLPRQAEVYNSFLNTRQTFMFGSVRSGKTEVQQWCLLKAVHELPPGNIQIIGKTLTALQRNFITPLQNKFPGHVIYNRGTKTLTVFGRQCWVEGATNEGAVDRIQGQSLVGAFGDEILTWPQRFWEMLDTRLSDAGAVFVGTFNPGNPNHFVKKLIDREEELGIGPDGRKELRAWQFKLDENVFLDPSYIASLKKKYPKGSVLYRRFIDGDWVAAEGRVFPFFEDDPEFGFVVDKLPDSFLLYYLGLDYGITNPFVAQLWGLAGGAWYCIREVNWDSVKMGRQKTNQEYIADIAELCRVNGSIKYPEKVLVPPEEPEFRNVLRRCQYPQLNRVASAENAVLPGIEDLTSMLASGRLKIHSSCEATIKGFRDLVWDDKAQARGVDMYLKGGSGAPDHAVDCSRYIGREAMKVLRQMRVI